MDAVGGFRTGRDEIAIDGITPSAARYVETTVASDSFEDAKAAATGRIRRQQGCRFVATSGYSGFLFWNAGPGHTAPNAGIELYGGKSVAFFAATDLAVPV